MRTAVIEVGGLLSSLSALGAQKRLARLPGVKKAEVNYVVGSATVTFDETVIDLKAIRARVHECGYHCAAKSYRNTSAPRPILRPNLLLWPSIPATPTRVTLPDALPARLPLMRNTPPRP